MTAVQLDDAARAMLDRIRADPYENAPRLAFAAYIANAFPSHAKLIVAQCESDEVDPAILDAFRADLPPYMRDWRLVHGFLGWDDDQELAVPASAFIRDQALLERVVLAPVKILLRDAEPHLVEICDAPILRHFTRIGFRETALRPGDVEALAWSRRLAHLRELDLRDTKLTSVDLLPLFESRAFPELECLAVSDETGKLTRTKSLRRLATAAYAGSLRRLVVEGSTFAAELVDALEAMPRLESLELADVRLGDRGVERLAQLPNHFLRLRLSNTGCTQYGAVALAASPVMSLVETLDLELDALGEEGFTAVLGSAQLGAVRFLALAGGDTADAQIRSPVIRALLDAPHCSSLLRLSLPNNRIGSEGATELAGGNFRTLRTLDLQQNRIGDAGALALAAAPFLGNLRMLDLSNNDLTDATAHAFATALAACKRLRLRGTRLSPSAREALHARYGSRVSV